MHFLPPPFLLSCHSQNTRFATTMGQLFLLCRDFGMISGKEDHLGKALKKMPSVASQVHSVCVKEKMKSENIV